MMRTFVLKICNLLCWLAVLLLIGLIAGGLCFLVYKGFAGLNSALFFGNTPVWEAVIGKRPVWDGIWPALVGTFSLVCLTMFLALLPGISCGIFLSEYASPKQRNWGNSLVDILAGMPSIVMGLFGFLLILLLRHTFWPQANTCLLLAAGCLALLILPVIIVTTREALQAIPSNLRLTASSLGLKRWQSIRHIFLPCASKGILGGVVLAIGRAAEDMAVIMLTGVVANSGLPAGLTGKFEALPFHIYVISAEYQSADELTKGFSTSLVLLALSTLFLVGAGLLERAYRKRWKGGAHS